MTAKHVNSWTSVRGLFGFGASCDSGNQIRPDQHKEQRHLKRVKRGPGSKDRTFLRGNFENSASTSLLGSFSTHAKGWQGSAPDSPIVRRADWECVCSRFCQDFVLGYWQSSAARTLDPQGLKPASLAAHMARLKPRPFKSRFLKPAQNTELIARKSRSALTGSRFTIQERIGRLANALPRNGLRR